VRRFHHQDAVPCVRGRPWPYRRRSWHRYSRKQLGRGFEAGGSFVEAVDRYVEDSGRPGAASYQLAASLQRRGAGRCDMGRAWAGILAISCRRLAGCRRCVTVRSSTSRVSPRLFVSTNLRRFSNQVTLGGWRPSAGSALTEAGKSFVRVDG